MSSPGVLGDGAYCRVGDAPLDRYGVEFLAHVCHLADLLQTELRTDFLGCHGGRKEKPLPRLPEGLHEGRVVELAADPGFHPAFIEPGQKRASPRGLLARQEQGRTVEPCRKLAPVRAQQCGRAETRETAAAERMVEALHVEPGGERRVCDHHVQPVHGQRTQQFGKGLLAADDAHGVVHRHGRL